MTNIVALFLRSLMKLFCCIAFRSPLSAFYLLKCIISKLYFGCSTLVRQRPMKSLMSSLPALSIHSSLSFLKIGSLIFSDIVHDDGWPWYLVTERAALKKKNWLPKFGSYLQKLASRLSFLPYSQVHFISSPWNYIQW